MFAKKKILGLPISVAVLATIMFAAMVTGNSAIPTPAEAHPAQYHISKGEWKSYWVYPSPEPITVYYHPKYGDAPTQLKANIGYWVWGTGFPDVTIDMYVSSGNPGREGWVYLQTLRINEARHGDKSFPMWLDGGTYRFDIKRKWAVDWSYASITLGVKSY